MTVKFLKEEYQKKYDIKLQEFLKIKQVFLQAKRELDKYEKELLVEENLSYWLFGNEKKDFGYAIWHICKKSCPNCNLKQIELMLEKGADINHICEERTPLDIYIFSSYLPWRMDENTEKNVKKNIKILRKLGALTKEELDNQNK